MNNPMMNNPLMQMIGMMRSGGNPMALMQQLAQQNPQVGQVMQMMNGKNPQQLRHMAMNMAKERGTSIEQIARQLGLNLPE